MSFEYGHKWLTNRESIVRLIQNLTGEIDDLKKQVVELEEDTELFSEGDYLEDLYVLLEGNVELMKHYEDQEGNKARMVTDRLGPGSFIGLIAFTTGNRSMTTARVVRKGRAIAIKQEEFEDVLNQQSRMSYPMQQLMIANLVDRYQQNTSLQLKHERLNRQLKEERNQLHKAYKELEETQNLLIHKEKMATLGQLVAGFAHEINNPVSSLIRSSEAVAGQLHKLMEQDDNISKLQADLFKAGVENKPMDTGELRSRMNEMKQRFPDLPRPVLRKLAQLPKEMLQEIGKKGEREDIEKLLLRFETGRLLHNIQHSGTRIGNLVKSLKNYSRQDANSYEPLDLRDGIHDTIQMLSNRLKYHEVVLQLEDIPQTCGNAGELNQVWTNIIVNACDAMEKPGRVSIRCYTEGGEIIVKFADTGPGVPEEIRDSIFEPNFTTKNRSQKFGLGLGLAISNEIIQKHNGEITIGDAPEGGAEFTVRLPVTRDCE